MPTDGSDARRVRGAVDAAATHASAIGHDGPSIPGTLQDLSILAAAGFSLAAAASLRRRVEPAS